MAGDWVWYLGAGLLGAVAVWLFVWAWWGDRSRGRARCRKCWYSLDVLMGGAGGLPVCPECGWRAKKRGGLFRTRRRKAWAAAAVVLGTCAVTAGLTPRVRRDGVWSVTPTWAMWAVLRGGHVPSDAFSFELARRARTYEECCAAAERVYRLAPSVRLIRERGVKGVPIRARNDSVLGRSWQEGFTFAPGGWLVNDADVESSQSHENWWRPGVSVIRPSPLVAKRADTFRTRVCWHARTADPDMGRGVFDLTIPLADSIDQVMTPVKVSREALLGAIRPSLFVLPTTKNLALSVVDVSGVQLGGTLALGMKVEIVRRGEVVGRGRWYQGTDESSVSGRPVLVRFGASNREGDVNGPMTCELGELVADGCIVRFSTDDEMALAALGYDRYWQGSFEVPLAELVK